EIDFRNAAARFGLGRLFPVRHNHETDWIRHYGLPSVRSAGLVAGRPSAPEFFRVQPDRAPAPVADLLHHMARAAGPVAALAIPQADEVEPVRAEAGGGVKHPAIVAFVRVLARGDRSELERLNVQ